MPQKRKIHHLKISVVITVLVAIGTLIAVGVLFFQYNALEKTTPAQNIQQSLVYDASQDENMELFDSSLGFTIPYNKKQYTAIGYTIKPDLSFQTYKGQDVLKKREYAIANFYDSRINNKDNVKLKKYSSAELDVSTNINNDFFERRKAQYGANLSEIDLVEKFFAPKVDAANEAVEVIRSNKTTIENVEYRHVVYKTTNKKLFKSTSVIEKYYTVQDGKPFAVTLFHADDTDQEFVASLRSLIAAISYGAEQQSSQYGDENSRSSGKVSDRVEDTAVNIPKDLKYKTALEVVAKNQPSTVRIGTVYCVKVQLINTDKSPGDIFDKACNGAIGSGSIISNDGYISTNGHVVTLKPQDVLPMAILIPFFQGKDEKPLRTYLAYLVKNGILRQDDVEEVVSAIAKADDDMINQLVTSIATIPNEQLKIESDTYKYAIQLGKQPIRLLDNQQEYTFNYKDNEIVEATLVDKNFNINDDINTGVFTASDVAVLKITDSKKYPIMKIGSINNLKEGDLVTAIGYPAFVDNGLDTKQKYTFPTATQGKVKSIEYDSDDKQRRLVGSNTPIAAGNSGGPAFSQEGQYIGLNTYGVPGCKTDDCFGQHSFFRDVNDLKQLVEKNNITLQQNSEISQVWNKGIDDFAQSNFGSAKQQFLAVKQKYPSFYLADSFLKVTDEQLAIERKETTLKIAIGLLIGFFTITVIGAILLLRKVLHHHKEEAINTAQLSPQQTQNPTFTSPTIQQVITQQQPQNSTNLSPRPYEQPIQGQPKDNSSNQPDASSEKMLIQNTSPVTSQPEKTIPNPIVGASVEVKIDHNQDIDKYDK